MKTFSKYLAFTRIAAVQAVSDRAELYGRMVFVAVILGVFSALWRAVGESGMPVDGDPTALVWYLGATEWILLSPPMVHVVIEGDVRRGDVAYQLQRPYSYLGAIAAQGIGATAVRAPVTATAVVLCGFVFTGRLPDAQAFVYLVPFGIAGMGVVYLLYVLTGLTAFWIDDVSPVFWVGQKLLFVLGGLMMPLTIYPEWIQRLAALTPFPFILAGPASFLLDGEPPSAPALAWRLALWLIAAALAAHLLFQRAVRSLQVNGG
jgi:ABC-2 type transport system permease protein